jgi:hypothetical protein
LNVKNAPYNAKGDGKTDDSAAIQAALNAATANQVVYLPASTYLIGSTLVMTHANTSIRGDGPTATILNYTGTRTAIATPGLWNWSPRISVTSAATRGATQITLANASGIFVGDLVVISQVNPSYTFMGDLSWGGAPGANGGGSNDATRGMEQVDRVAAVSGNTLSLERPLYLTFPFSNSPAINHMTPITGSASRTFRSSGRARVAIIPRSR